MKKVDELEDRIEALEIDKAVSKKIRAICITATSTFIGICYAIGQWAYEKWNALEAGIRAFWIANRGGQ